MLAGHPTKEKSAGRKALSGLKALEYTNRPSGAYCGKMLAELGVEVLKIEPPGTGDPARSCGPFPQDIPNPEQSGMFLWLNTNKLSITLDLKMTQGRTILTQLLKQADIFINSFTPKQAKKLGLKQTSLKQINSQLIIASVTPFGQSGPYKDYVAYDINCSGAAGVSVTIGAPDREPIRMPMFLGAYQAGAATTAAILISLLAREAGGNGQSIDISEVESWTTMHTGYLVSTYIYQGVSGIRKGRHRAYFHYPNSVLECKDGYIALIAPQLDQWVRFVQLMGNPVWSEEPRYRDRRAMAEQYPDEVDTLLSVWLKQHTKEEIFKLCRQNHIPFAPVRTIGELTADPHLKARRFFQEVYHPAAGTFDYPGPAYTMHATPASIDRHAPLLGQHNQEILCGRLEYSREDLINLRKAGVI